MLDGLALFPAETWVANEEEPGQSLCHLLCPLGSGGREQLEGRSKHLGAKGEPEGEGRAENKVRE